MSTSFLCMIRAVFMDILLLKRRSVRRKELSLKRKRKMKMKSGLNPGGPVEHMKVKQPSNRSEEMILQP
ncbi:hypothetical protein L6164_019661 [Bauhinia variegata]|uniref:Uncharacterized protein n=1 Tax=Bauhinia variegata TaxID=167791 RepID=A0ACB9MUI0_BAUVA|nr:hypothetical protein L6164_019661 [Bauhinia variegata]